MYPELTNLLPSSYARQLRHSYFMRLLTVTVIVGIFLLFIHALLLVPSYLYASTRLSAANRELDKISTNSATAEEQQAQTRVRALQTDVKYLDRLSTTPTASGAIRALLLVPKPGVNLSGFSYTAPQAAGGDASMLITGTASTRDALRSYTLALGALPYIKNVDLPISAYAKESDIPFTLTVTGSLMP